MIKPQSSDYWEANLTCAHTNTKKKSNVILKGSSTDQILSLFFNGHEFESLQSHWRLTWSLTSRLVGLVKVHARWPDHLY
jgi:hypothetical protein